MRQQISNTVYGLLDYAAYPIGMLAVAPLILRNLGVAQYGVWTVATSIVSLGSMVASGFGDANIQKVAIERGTSSRKRLLRVVRAAMGIHLALGIAMGLAIWIVAPTLANHITATIYELRGTCLACIHMGAVFVGIRALETVCISTQRAFERYGAAIRISVAARVLGLGGAAVLASFTRNVTTIMALTAALAGIAVVAQYIRLLHLLETKHLLPSFDPAVSKDLFQFGVFTWLIAVAGVLFSQGDRLIGGTWMGASALVAYALCAQISQPVYGMTASGLHFVFPYIASRQRTATPSMLRTIVLVALLCNGFLVLFGSGVLLIYSDRILHLLADESIATACARLLPGVLAGPALLALSVTGGYTMVALGQARLVALLNLAGALAGAGVVSVSWHHLGLTSIIAGRIAFALVALFVHAPLLRYMRVCAQPIEGLQANRSVVEEA